MTGRARARAKPRSNLTVEPKRPGHQVNITNLLYNYK